MAFGSHKEHSEKEMGGIKEVQSTSSRKKNVTPRKAACHLGTQRLWGVLCTALEDSILRRGKKDNEATNEYKQVLTILVKLMVLNIKKCINNNRGTSCPITIMNELDIKTLVSIDLTKHHNTYYFIFYASLCNCTA